jgi:hypothetical protein
MHRLITLVTRSKLEYASVAWNSMASTDCNKPKRIQQRFSALCFNRFFQVHYCYPPALEELKLHTLRMRRHRLDALFFLFEITLLLNSVHVSWKLLAFDFLLGIIETLHRSTSAPHVKTVPLLDVYQLLMFTGALTYWCHDRSIYSYFIISCCCCYYCY